MLFEKIFREENAYLISQTKQRVNNELSRKEKRLFNSCNDSPGVKSFVYGEIDLRDEQYQTTARGSCCFEIAKEYDEILDAYDKADKKGRFDIDLFDKGFVDSMEGYMGVSSLVDPESIEGQAIAGSAAIAIDMCRTGLARYY